jgi:hypothetical protein
MIPKTIHYCWFGGKPLPESALRCIESWRKHLPGYQIRQWNESNFNVREIPYTSQAYDAGKYAFVSDYARFKILHTHGGLYFDTDVELISPIDDIIADGPFMGFENDATEAVPGVNPGLGLGAEPQMPFYDRILRAYASRSFTMPDGSLNLTTVVTYTTEELDARGLRRSPGIQRVDGITLYPAEYFNPLDDNTGRLVKTANTRSIHWYSKTWHTRRPWVHKISRIYHRIAGPRISAFIRKILKR